MHSGWHKDVMMVEMRVLNAIACVTLMGAMGSVAFAQSIQTPASRDASANMAVCQQVLTAYQQQLKGAVATPTASDEQKRQALSQVLSKVINVDLIAQFAAGQYWDNANAKDRAAYIAAYRAVFDDIYLNPNTLPADVILGIKDVRMVDDLTPTKVSTVFVGHLQDIYSDDKRKPFTWTVYLVSDTANGCAVRDWEFEGNTTTMLTKARDKVQSMSASGGLPEATRQLNEFYIKKMTSDGSTGSKSTDN